MAALKSLSHNYNIAVINMLLFPMCLHGHHGTRGSLVTSGRPSKFWLPSKLPLAQEVSRKEAFYAKVGIKYEICLTTWFALITCQGVSRGTLATGQE
jgi:hypothetical protein